MKQCPICKGPLGKYPALSRRDNKTDICSECGVNEALEDYLKYKYSHDQQDLEAWGSSELIEYILELESELHKLITFNNEHRECVKADI
jgi:hypothetical protein